MSEKDFLEVLNGIAKSWMSNDASRAAEYFDMNAVYEEPPKQQFFKGRESILEFFRSVMQGDVPLKMFWRNSAFDPIANVGFGEYTFARLKQFHGIVVIKFKDGKILKWREYQYQSDLAWEKFAGESEFTTFKKLKNF